MAEIIPLMMESSLDFPVEKVLAEAKNCRAVVILAWDENGEFAMLSSRASLGEALVLLRRGQLLADEWVMETCDAVEVESDAQEDGSKVQRLFGGQEHPEGGGVRVHACRQGQGEEHAGEGKEG